jgi:hypothetical protein
VESPWASRGSGRVAGVARRPPLGGRGRAEARAPRACARRVGLREPARRSERVDRAGLAAPVRRTGRRRRRAARGLPSLSAGLVHCGHGTWAPCVRPAPALRRRGDADHRHPRAWRVRRSAPRFGQFGVHHPCPVSGDGRAGTRSARFCTGNGEVTSREPVDVEAGFPVAAPIDPITRIATTVLRRRSRALRASSAGRDGREHAAPTGWTARRPPPAAAPRPGLGGSRKPRRT